jgi:hypothetical protein
MIIYSAEWKFFKYLRRKFSVDKPIALGAGEWEKWELALKKEKPSGYFLTETVPDLIDDIARFIPTPISNIRYYCRNRFHRKCHVLSTGFTPGEYHDLDERILYGLMNSLVDYVEVDLAYKNRWCNTEESKKAKWKNGRCIELGLAHLAWEMSLDDPKLDQHERCEGQAETAREIKVIYDWWKTVRPARPDPYDASGWSDLCDEKRADGLKWYEQGSDEYEETKTAALATLRKIESAYEEEDEQMLMRLIKIRRSLWA